MLIPYSSDSFYTLFTIVYAVLLVKIKMSVSCGRMRSRHKQGPYIKRRKRLQNLELHQQKILRGKADWLLWKEKQPYVIRLQKHSKMRRNNEEQCTSLIYDCCLFTTNIWAGCFEPTDYLCPFVSAVAFFVWLTRLMKNVRHDCLLNPLICGSDPINHDPASTTNSPAFYQVYFGYYSEGWAFFVCLFFFCLPTVSTALPAYQLFQWLLLQSWMGFKDGAARGDKEGSYFHISALLD